MTAWIGPIARRLGLVVVALLAAAPATAQTTAPPAAGGPDDLRPAEIQRLFDAYLVMEAQQTLDLSETQYPPFLTRLRALQELRRRQLQARAQLLGELARLSAPRAAGDEGVIRERLAALQELESRHAAESRKAYGEIDALLTPRQQARFRVFEERIERRKIELMLRARQGARPGQRPFRRQ
ncbi:MAG: hypothetical protein AB7H93_20960 [Vicinamibacterales bacterium]